jgi:hypothetical protein
VDWTPSEKAEPPGDPASFDAVDALAAPSGRRRQWRAPKPQAGAEVRLGSVVDGGLAPAVAAIVERGVLLRPHHARTLRAVVELSIDGPHPPVRMAFRGAYVLVEDGSAEAADLRVAGALADLIALMIAPTLGGLPSPIDPRGRAALGNVASRRIRVRGRIRLMRRLLVLMRI